MTKEPSVSCGTRTGPLFVPVLEPTSRVVENVSGGGDHRRPSTAPGKWWVSDRCQLDRRYQDAFLSPSLGVFLPWPSQLLTHNERLNAWSRRSKKVSNPETKGLTSAIVTDVLRSCLVIVKDSSLGLRSI